MDETLRNALVAQIGSPLWLPEIHARQADETLVIEAATQFLIDLARQKHHHICEAARAASLPSRIVFVVNPKLAKEKQTAPRDPPTLQPPENAKRISVLRVTDLSAHSRTPAWLLGGNVDAEIHWIKVPGEKSGRSRLCRAASGPCLWCNAREPFKQMVYLPVLLAFAWPRTSLAIVPLAEQAAGELLEFGGRGLFIELRRLARIQAGIKVDVCPEQIATQFELPRFDPKPILLRLLGERDWPVAPPAASEDPPATIPFRKAEGA